MKEDLENMFKKSMLKAKNISDITVILTIITVMIFIASFFVANNNKQNIVENPVANNQNQQEHQETFLPPQVADDDLSDDYFAQRKIKSNQPLPNFHWQAQDIVSPQKTMASYDTDDIEPYQQTNNQKNIMAGANQPVRVPTNSAKQKTSYDANDNTQNNNSNQQENIPTVVSNNDVAKNPNYKVFDFKYSNKSTISGTLAKVTVTYALPQSEQYQTVTTSYVGREPSSISSDSNSGKKNAKIELNSVSNTKVVCGYQGQAKTLTYDLSTAKKIGKNSNPESDLSAYLTPEKYIESNNAYIISVAKAIKKGNTREQTVQNIYTYVKKNISYQKLNKNIGAKKALQLHRGKCVEFASAMIALCRAKGIPARSVVGFYLNQGTLSTYHAWVEVYYDEYGWVTYDPTLRVVTSKGSQVFDSTILNANYLVLWRNDLTFPTTINYTYNQSTSSNNSYSTNSGNPSVVTKVTFSSNLSTGK